MDRTHSRQLPLPTPEVRPLPVAGTPTIAAPVADFEAAVFVLVGANYARHLSGEGIPTDWAGRVVMHLLRAWNGRYTLFSRAGSYNSLVATCRERRSPKQTSCRPDRRRGGRIVRNNKPFAPPLNGGLTAVSALYISKMFYNLWVIR